MSGEFLFLGNQGDVAEDAVASLLIQRCQDAMVVRFRVAEPLACQHFLNTARRAIKSARSLSQAGLPPGTPLLRGCRLQGTAGEHDLHIPPSSFSPFYFSPFFSCSLFLRVFPVLTRLRCLSLSYWESLARCVCVCVCHLMSGGL